MSYLGPVGGSNSLRGALGRWQQHITFVLLTEGALGVVGGAESKLNAAGGEIALSSAFGRWARALSKAVDVGVVEGVVGLLSAAEGELGRTPSFAWGLISSLREEASFYPLDDPGLKAWWSTQTNTTVDGQPVTLRVDLSPTGADMLEAAVGTAAVYQTDRFDGSPCVFFNGDCLKTTHPDILDLINGTDKQLTMVAVVQETTNSTNYLGVFGNAANSSYFQARQLASAYRTEISPRSTAGTPTSAKEVALNVPTPQIRVIRKLAGNLVQFGVDGSSETPVSVAMGSFSVDAFAQGGIPTTSPIVAGTLLSPELFLYEGNKTDAELQLLFKYLAKKYPTALGWKENLGAVAGNPAGTMIVTQLGQSNAEGAAVESYLYTADRVKCLYPSMFLKTLVDPTSNPTNSVFGINGTGSGNSMSGPVADQLRSLFAHDLLFVNAGVTSTSSTTWNTGTTADPPSIANLIGRAKMMMLSALSAPGAVLGPIIIYQGETDAQTSAASWISNWDAICTELKSFFAGKFLDPDNAFLVVKLPVTAPTSASFPAWDDVRTAQQTFVDTTRSDCALVQAPPATLGGELHLDMGLDDTSGFRKLAVDGVAAWAARL